MNSRNLDKNFQEKIQPIREEIDAIDAKILFLLARRKNQIEKVVSLKKQYEIPIFIPAREADLISNLRKLALEFHIDPDFIEELYNLILSNSRADQTIQDLQS